MSYPTSWSDTGTHRRPTKSTRRGKDVGYRRHRQVAAQPIGTLRAHPIMAANVVALRFLQVGTVVLCDFPFMEVNESKYRPGIVVGDSKTGEIARYDSGRLNVVSSPIASKLGLTASDLIPVSAGQYGAVTKGPDYFIEGMFLQNNQTGELANYSGGQRHWVSSPVASQINLTPAMITAIGADQFNAIPRGGDYTPPAPTPLDPTLA